MKEKRIRERRLDFNSGRTFPFQAADGRIIYRDRRRTADRRLNNIWLELVSLKPGDIPHDWGHKVRRSISASGNS